MKLSNKGKVKKSQILLVGSLLIFVGVFCLLGGHLKVLKEALFEEVRLKIFYKDVANDGDVINVSDSGGVSNVVDSGSGDSPSTSEGGSSFRYNYIGYLEIPKIRLKRGFVSPDSKYNNIQYNVTISERSVFPDVQNGNFILYAHSGDAYISFFAYLYKLDIGDIAYVTYNGVKYKYQLVKVEVQPKGGYIAIHRPNYDVGGLTLITCTKDSDSEQSIYIFELV